MKDSMVFTEDELDRLERAVTIAVRGVIEVFEVIGAASIRTGREWEPKDEGMPVREIIDLISSNGPEVDREALKGLFGMSDCWQEPVEGTERKVASGL